MAQIIGAIIASGVILLVANGLPGGYSASASGLGADGYGLHSPDHYSLAAGFIAETVLTMFLVVTVLGATDISAPVGFAGLAIGLVLTLIHLVGIPITNTSVNPARSIGPALFVGGWALQQLWMFIVAPFVGAVILAAIVYAGLRHPAVLITTRKAEQALPGNRSTGSPNGKKALRGRSTYPDLQRTSGAPHLAKNERDVGAPGLRGEERRSPTAESRALVVTISAVCVSR